MNRGSIVTFVHRLDMRPQASTGKYAAAVLKLHIAGHSVLCVSCYCVVCAPVQLVTGVYGGGGACGVTHGWGQPSRPLYDPPQGTSLVMPLVCECMTMLQALQLGAVCPAAVNRKKIATAPAALARITSADAVTSFACHVPFLHSRATYANPGVLYPPSRFRLRAWSGWLMRSMEGS